MPSNHLPRAGSSLEVIDATNLVVLAFCISLTAASAQSPPSNDSCNSPMYIGSVPGEYFVGNHYATTGIEGQSNATCASPEGSPAFGSVAIENDVWFIWTADCNGTAEVSTCIAGQSDTKLAVYGPTTTCPSETDPAIACNDDGCGSSDQGAFVAFEVQCCQQFLIQIGEKPGTSLGTLRFSVTCTQDSRQQSCGSSAGCCLPSGACANVDSTCCASLGGTPSSMGFACSGDGNFNQLDDACECNPHLSCLACPGEICRPTEVRPSDIRGDFDILECACESATSCFVVMDTVIGDYSCEGACAPELSCVATWLAPHGWGGTISCSCETPCTTSADCDDMSICSCDQCNEGGCSYTPNVKFGDSTANGIVNLDDILCTLAGFANNSICQRADWGPNCNADGIISLDDILATLAAFSGANHCGCPNISEFAIEPVVRSPECYFASANTMRLRLSSNIGFTSPTPSRTPVMKSISRVS